MAYWIESDDRSGFTTWSVIIVFVVSSKALVDRNDTGTESTPICDISSARRERKFLSRRGGKRLAISARAESTKLGLYRDYVSSYYSSSSTSTISVCPAEPGAKKAGLMLTHRDGPTSDLS